ncbi:hypothetical protein DFH06DRAFT_288221 [Mycena polygramma]|nr:hypothetical protein DFH06DRAFT_288221 [Mycena polygramma]
MAPIRHLKSNYGLIQLANFPAKKPPEANVQLDMDVTGPERGSKGTCMHASLYFPPPAHCVAALSRGGAAGVGNPDMMPRVSPKKAAGRQPPPANANETCPVLSDVQPATDAPRSGAHSFETTYRRPPSGFTELRKKAAGRHTATTPATRRGSSFRISGLPRRRRFAAPVASRRYITLPRAAPKSKKKRRRQAHGGYNCNSTRLALQRAK